MSSNANAILVATRVSDTRGGPDAVAVGTGAGDEAGSVELEVAILDGPALALGVLGSGLDTDGVANLALACDIVSLWCTFLGYGWKASRTHAGAVNVDLLGTSGVIVDVENTVVDIETGLLAAVALVLKASDQATLGGAEASVLDTATGVNGDDAEEVRGISGRGGRRGRSRSGGAVSGRGSGGSSNDGGSESKVLELHFESLMVNEWFWRNRRCFKRLD